MVLRLMTGRLAASGGKSHSCVTAASRSPRPNANTISGALGRREQIVGAGVFTLSPAPPLAAAAARSVCGSPREPAGRDGSRAAANEMVEVVTSMMAMVAVPAASAVSGPRRDQDDQDGDHKKERADHTALRSPEAARRSV